MLRRVNNLLNRASSKTHVRLNPTLRPPFKRPYFDSHSFRSAPRRRVYVVWAVAGVFVTTSFRESFLDHTEEEDVMAPLDLPGRPWNLTDEQQGKLKEMWQVAYKVFGMPVEQPPSLVLENGSNPSLSKTNTGLSDTKEKKGSSKKLTSMFKKKKDKDSSATASPDLQPADISNLSISGGEDKYSQTKEFKEALSSSTPQEIHDTFWRMVKADHPDSLFLRFLRARKWDVNKAIIMLIATMHWRSKVVDVEDLIKKGELYSVETNDTDFLLQLRLGKSYLHGLDIHDRPICLVRTRLHHASDQQPEAVERFTVWEMETARLMLSEKVDTACVIFDMTGFTLSNMDYTPVKFLIKAFEAHYPESLGVCLVHKAPWVFQGIWNIIKGWLDPVVASKIHFTRSVDDLERFIPRSRMVKELEGDEQFEYKYVEPIPGENDIQKDTETRDKIQEERSGMVERFEDATRRWILGEDTKAERDDIVKELNENYWKLDPYIRAKTVYDRTGAIGERGGWVYRKTEDSNVTEEVKVTE